MTDSADDARLVERMALKDAAALRAFLTRHQLRVYRFVRRLIEDDALAEDLANEVFLEAWSTADAYDFRLSVPVWILGIAHRRFEAARESRGEDAWSSREESDGPVGRAGGAEGPNGGALARRMRELSAGHREIIDLVYYHEMSIAETAAILAITGAAAQERLFAARKRLAELTQSTVADGE